VNPESEVLAPLNHCICAARI